MYIVLQSAVIASVTVQAGLCLTWVETLKKVHLESYCINVDSHYFNVVIYVHIHPTNYYF